MLHWQQRKSRLCHDHLKNGLNLEVARLRRILSGDVSLSHTDLRNGTWQEVLSEVRELLESFILEMSPRNLFLTGSLRECDDETKMWLSEILHERWIADLDASGLIARAKALSADVEQELAQLSGYLAIVNLTSKVKRDDRIYMLADSVYAKIISLSDVLNLFPDRIWPLRQ
jgi:hypothetical protein